jgi:hypothetical protein
MSNTVLAGMVKLWMHFEAGNLLPIDARVSPADNEDYGSVLEFVDLLTRGCAYVAAHLSQDKRPDIKAYAAFQSRSLKITVLN